LQVFEKIYSIVFSKDGSVDVTQVKKKKKEAKKQKEKAKLQMYSGFVKVQP